MAKLASNSFEYSLDEWELVTEHWKKSPGILSFSRMAALTLENYRNHPKISISKRRDACDNMAKLLRNMLSFLDDDKATAGHYFGQQLELIVDRLSGMALPHGTVRSGLGELLGETEKKASEYRNTDNLSPFLRVNDPHREMFLNWALKEYFIANGIESVTKYKDGPAAKYIMAVWNPVANFAKAELDLRLAFVENGETARSIITKWMKLRNL